MSEQGVKIQKLYLATLTELFDPHTDGLFRVDIMQRADESIAVNLKITITVNFIHKSRPIWR